MNTARLTPHQGEVLARVCRRVRYRGETQIGIPTEDVGSRTALVHLEAKGFLVSEVHYGPRGGERRRWYLTDKARQWNAARIDRNRAAQAARLA